MAEYARGHGVQASTAAAINIECGFIPDFVMVYNVSDETEINYADMRELLAFDGGGGSGLEIVSGDTIEGSTGWQAVVDEVILTGGSWAGGNAAGYLVLRPGSRTSGTVTDNTDIKKAVQQGADPSGDYATVNGTAQPLHLSAHVDGNAGAVGQTGNAAITAYVGAAGTNSRGFTIGSTVLAASQVFFWHAWGEGVG